jgi:hypothetical protein
VFESGVLRRIFRLKREKLVVGERRLHNEELYNMYTLPNIIWAIRSRGIRWTGHVAHMGEMRSAYNIFFGKPERKRPLRKPRQG